MNVDTKEKQIKSVISFGQELLNGLDYHRNISNKIIKTNVHPFDQELDNYEIANKKPAFTST